MAGRIVDADRPGTAIHQGGLLAKLQDDHGQTHEIRSPIPGRIRSVAQTGANVAASAEVAMVDPGTEQVWEALRALYLVGQVEDLPAIRPYERDCQMFPTMYATGGRDREGDPGESGNKLTHWDMPTLSTDLRGRLLSTQDTREIWAPIITWWTPARPGMSQKVRSRNSFSTPRRTHFLSNASLRCNENKKSCLQG